VTRLRYIGHVRESWAAGPTLYSLAMKQMLRSGIQMPMAVQGLSRCKRLIWLFENVPNCTKLQVFKEPKKTRRSCSLYLARLKDFGIFIQARKKPNKAAALRALAWTDPALDIQPDEGDLFDEPV
jgi:hypothetical protein